MVIVKYVTNVKDVTKSVLPDNFTGKTYNNHGFYFYKNNLSHRYYGPAQIWNGLYRTWWFNNNFYGNYYNYNQKQFLKDVNKSWLL